MAVAIQVRPALATIQHTNVLETFYVNDVYFDMDLDGDDDFAFYHNGSGHGVSCVKPSSCVAANALDEPKAYSEGAGMGMFQWVSTNGSLYRFDGTDKFLMLKFNDTSGNTYYGWARIVDAGTQFISMDMRTKMYMGNPFCPGQQFPPASKTRLHLTSACFHRSLGRCRLQIVPI